MALKEYARKRSFARTPEPAPGEAGASAGSKSAPEHKPTFVIQRHHARALHYDFRLEMEGVLKSWAVPKGPTLDPSQKRLAVHVEDHPLEYAAFEGNIPAGQYGAGSVMVWDRGTYETLGKDPELAQYDRGDLKFRLEGEKLRGEFALVRMKGRGENQWLLLKKRDAAAVGGWDPEDYSRSVVSGRSQEEIAQDLPPKASLKRKVRGKGKGAEAGEISPVTPAELPGAIAAPLFGYVPPMLASLGDAPPEGEDWRYEIKWDGMRILLFIDQGKVRLLSRRGKDTTRQFPELTVAHQFVAAEQVVLDGEVALLDEQGRPSFSLLQPRMMAGDAGAIARMARARPVTFFVFDLLYLDGYDLRNAPMWARRQTLERILKPSPLIRYSQNFSGSGAEFLEAARAQGLEGIVAKKADSFYQSRRSLDWIKIKIAAQQEFVICGWLEGERETFASLVLGLYEGGQLVHAGNVGTGFDEGMLRALSDKLRLLITPRSPFAAPPKMPRPVTWVRPELVCTVRFASWTPDGKLRAPVFLGLRPDVEPAECTRSGADGASLQEQTQPVVGPALEGNADTVTVTVEGRRLRFSNLKKLYYPGDGCTKRDVIRYYDAVAPWLLPHLRDRPLSLLRYPDGIEGESFFQKDARKDFPEWFHVEPIPTEEGGQPKRFVVADDRASLLFLANLGCIDQNPWMSRVGSLENPDFILIDLDPQDCGYERIVEAAQLIRRKLDLLELAGYPKTTGGRGMHIYVPLEAVYSYDQTRSFTELLARWVAAERPDLFTTPRPVARREKGKVYFDYLQNGFGKTVSAPYVLRAYPGAPVATPVAWHEVAPGLLPTQFRIRNALERFEQLGDLFRPVLECPQRLELALDKLASAMPKESSVVGDKMEDA
ncbi:MAG: DNA ligase D [Acidobacteria bacterium]|nr:DNA ligase D [Acidobacteriota bacterium]